MRRWTIFVPYLAVAALVVLAVPAHAQWTDDLFVNLTVADGSGPQVQPKLAATPDGGFYVSWYDNSTGGYDVRLQRLDRHGFEVWPHNGVLVADRSFSSTQDYGLAADSSGNALLAFRDDRSGVVEITAAKVERDGSQPWGANGVQVSNAAGAFVAAPKIAGTTDGRVIVAWTQDAEVKSLKLTAAGTAFWPATVTFTPGAGSFAVADLHASDSGSAIVSFIHPTGGFGSPIHLWAQKLGSATGSPQWGTGHVQLFDDPLGSLQFGNFPPFVIDGSGGAVFSWYTNSPSLQCRVQRVLANGTEAWPHQGLEVSTDVTKVRVSPSAAYDPATGDTWVFWLEQPGSQADFGVWGQRFDAAGVPQWTAVGAPVQPIQPDEITSIRATWAPGAGAIASWIQAFAPGQDLVRAALMDPTGVPAWLPPVVDLSGPTAEKARLASARSVQGYTAYAWEEGGSSNADVRAQSQRDDGVLAGFVLADGFESGDTSAWSSVVP